MKIDKVALGLAVGLVWGGAMLALTLIVLALGGGEHMALIGKFYLGYTVSPLGALIGMVWGFVDGFVAGWILAWLYNLFARAPA